LLKKYLKRPILMIVKNRYYRNKCSRFFDVVLAYESVGISKVSINKDKDALKTESIVDVSAIE
jgi:hypothetical protein